MESLPPPPSLGGGLIERNVLICCRMPGLPQPHPLLAYSNGVGSSGILSNNQRKDMMISEFL